MRLPISKIVKHITSRIFMKIYDDSLISCAIFSFDMPPSNSDSIGSIQCNIHSCQISLAGMPIPLWILC